MHNFCLIAFHFSQFFVFLTKKLTSSEFWVKQKLILSQNKMMRKKLFLGRKMEFYTPFVSSKGSLTNSFSLNRFESVSLKV